MQYRHIVRLLFIGMIVGLSPMRRVEAQQITLSFEFQYLRQGTAGIVRLSGSDISSAVAVTFNRSYRFFLSSQGYVCLLAVPMEQKIQDYPLHVTIVMGNGSTVAWDGSIKVASGQFITEPPFRIPANKVYLLRSDIENAEEDRMGTIYSIGTPDRFWDGQFTPPVGGTLISAFGSSRLYLNDGVSRRHTGDDLAIAAGTPVLAASNGRVVFARPLDIHGNNVIIDHGWGVFSEYAHMSQIFVVPGQFVLQGDVIGKSGTTGRSTGPHVHWEVAVSGVQVDPLAFMHMKLPS